MSVPSASSAQIDSRVTTQKVSAGAAAGAALFTIIVFLGFGAAIFIFVPIIGWVFGPLIAIVGLVAVSKGGANGAKANCPYCGLETKVLSKPGNVGRCLKCRNDYVYRDGQLSQIKKGV
jgi:hypothetical protein